MKENPMGFLPNIDALLLLGWRAADAIMLHHDTEVAVQQKSDLSPVSEADMQSHHILTQGLGELYPDIAIISEEDDAHPAMDEGYYWLVDPLDGTKSFIKGRKDFTINIGLMHAHRPVFGLLIAPYFNEAYWGGVACAAHSQMRGEEALAISCAAQPNAGEVLQVLVSQSHPDARTQDYLDGLSHYESHAIASAYKFCIIARGDAHLYPRFGPTMEWDSAAGHALVEAAGGTLTNPDGSDFLYAKPAYKNGPFITRAW